MKLLKREDTVMVVIDFQEKLMPAMSDKEELENTTVRLIKGTRELKLPHIVTQQYTKGIGATIPSIADALGDFTPIDKTTFSCMANEEFVEQLKATGCKTVIVCGIEAHICVQQTVLELLEAGYDVYVVADCVSSRKNDNMMWSVALMGEAGAVITTYEAVLYELLRDAKSPEFKAISAVVK